MSFSTINKFCFLSLFCIFNFHVNAQTVVMISGSDDWTPTGYTRNSGEDMIICSKGEIRAWSIALAAECWRLITPSGIGRSNFTSTSVPCTNCPVLSLIGKIGINGTPFYVGDRCVLQASASNLTGELFLRINDGTLNDNTGIWEVSISNNCIDLADNFALPIYSPGIVQVDASQDWIATGISKNTGDEIIFCGKGEIRAWTSTLTECWRLVTPAGLGRINYVSATFPCTNCPILSLIGKVGQNGTPFYIGDRAVLQADNGLIGEIFLRVNDLSIDDNTGEFSVAITKNCNEIVSCFGEQTPTAINTPDKYNSNVISFYPNPASDIINMKFNANKGGNLLVKIFDLTGKLLRSENFEAIAGEQIITLKIPEYLGNQLIMVQTIFENQNFSNLLRNVK
jgi:hypothetical protein